MADSTVEQTQLRLDRLDDEISARIRAIAESLRLRVRVRVEHLVDDRALAFGKLGGEWQFIVATDHDERPLLGCSRDERIEMVSHIAALVDSIASQLVAMVPAREAAIRELDRLIDFTTKEI